MPYKKLTSLKFIAMEKRTAGGDDAVSGQAFIENR